MPAPIVLLPPSEGKATGGHGAPYTAGSMSFGELDPSRQKVAAALRRTMRTNATTTGKLLGVKGEALAAARLTNRDVLTSPTLPAIERYTGVLFGALDAATLSATARRRADDQLVIFSGLWGIVSPRDPVPDYKLKMGASLPPMGRLASWWRPHLTAALAPKVAGRTVWDLLPIEHASAWAPAAGSLGARISVKFLDDVPAPTGRKLVAVSHWNKLLKGALVRHLLQTQLDDPDGLAAFDHPLGYRYEPSLTAIADGRLEVAMVARRD